MQAGRTRADTSAAAAANAASAASRLAAGRSTYQQEARGTYKCRAGRLTDLEWSSVSEEVCSATASQCQAGSYCKRREHACLRTCFEWWWC